MKIAFLHPYKMSDHYFVETIESAAIADLRSAGHDAEAADFLFDPARSEEDQIREMRAALEAQGYELLFLERPWSDAMVKALSGLRIVAYCRPEMVRKGLVDLGVAHASRKTIRALVDAIVAGNSLDDIAGLILRRGDEVIETRGGESPTMLGELRDAEYDYAHRRVLSSRASNPTRVVVASNTGCAYRNAPNRTGVFDGVEMPASVKTAGCTFCDVMPYERMTEQEAIALIVKQVETVLRDRPEVTEIAIKDDYALRFLLALGDALAPLGVNNKRLLLSARADYLLQFRSEIEEALSGRFPAALGFYLIGFENFSQAELERFNKGMSAAQIERVLVLMREWSERFPSRFMLSPTGGFILFTPWTTLEDLRINANAIRQLGFSEFRGKALLSQLRLHPELPLYWLAKHDGLLIDKFERQDMSDAFRRGYESDHPWRFKDEKVAQVHRQLLDAAALSDSDMFGLFEDALDDAAGVARGKRNRGQRMVRAPRDEARRGPSTHQVALNRECNQGCAFCIARGVDTMPPRQRAARAIQAVHAAAKQGVRTVILGGAEPTREWYLADLIRLARDLGVSGVTIETNATLLGQGSMAADLAAAGLTGALVAYNSLDPVISDAITRDPGGHARTEAGVRALLAAGVSVEFAVAILPSNRGALSQIVREITTRFAGANGSIIGVVARYIGAGPAAFRPLPVELAAIELRDAASAAAISGVALRAAPGGELPPCVFEAPNEVKSIIRIGQILVERDSSNYQRIQACERCDARTVCAGPLKSIAARVAPMARPLGNDERGAGLVPMSEERARVLLEYRSQFFLKAPDGELRERRIVRVNFHCNQACDFCFVSRELPPVEHERIVKEITEAAERKAVLDLSGGEPTLNARITEYLKLARDLGVPEVELQTNAIKMADATFARDLVDAGLSQVFVSLHGVTPEVCDRVTAAPGTFVKTVQGIKNLLDLGVVVRLNFVLCGYNVRELARLPDFVAREFLRDHPDARLDINFSYVAASTDNVPRDTGLIPRFTDVAWSLKEAHERAVALDIRMTGFDSKCGVPACYLPRAIREEHFAKDIPAEELAYVGSGFTKSPACATCELDRRCYGIRTTYADLYGTDELRPVVAGEVSAAPIVHRPASLRGTIWSSIGLSASHKLIDTSAARLVDDGFWSPPSPSWSESQGSVLDREIVQLSAGLREVIKVERGSVGAAERAAAEFVARGFVARVFVDGGNAQRSPRAIAFIGRSNAAVDEAMAVEPGLVLPFGERDQLVRRMGALLGYPPCCVDLFARTADQDDATHIDRLSAKHTMALSFEQNWVAVPIRLFSHFPCTVTCAATAKLARETFSQISRTNPTYGVALERALKSVCVTGSADSFALLLDARADGPDVFRYEQVLSHRVLGVENAILNRPAFRAYYLEVIAPLEQGNRVRRTSTSLVVDRDGEKVAEILFGPQGSPRLLDFTGGKIVRRLAVAPLLKHPSSRSPKTLRPSRRERSCQGLAAVRHDTSRRSWAASVEKLLSMRSLVNAGANRASMTRLVRSIATPSMESAPSSTASVRAWRSV